jgi:hypothetical protein
MTLPPDQEGGAPSPPPIDQETPTSPETSPPALANPRPPTPLTEGFLEASALPGALVEHLRKTLEALESPAALSLIARMEPITVRAAEPSTVTPGRLELPDGAAGLLGEEIESHVLTDGERLRVWLAGTTRVQPGSTVTLIAITAAGEIAEATVVAGSPAEDLELSLPWADAALPEAISLTFGNLR